MKGWYFANTYGKELITKALYDACKKVILYHPCTCTRSWPRAGNHEETCNQNILGKVIDRADGKETP